jgi:hypothetical protein
VCQPGLDPGMETRLQRTNDCSAFAIDAFTKPGTSRQPKDFEEYQGL